MSPSMQSNLMEPNRRRFRRLQIGRYQQNERSDGLRRNSSHSMRVNLHAAMLSCSGRCVMRAV
jgi:hypothetical protein